MAGSSIDSQTIEKDLSVEWNEDDTTLTRLKEDLPKICKYDGQISPGLKLYSQQPVLLYRWDTKRKANVRTIYRDPSGPFYEVGQTLQIPDDFDGWFEIVPPDFGRSGYYHSIEEVSQKMPDKIFIRTNLTGIRIDNSKEGGEETYLQRKIPAGSVLKVKSIFTGKWKTCVETGLRKKKQKEWTTHEIKYLKCIDNDRMEILVPFTSKGKFNPIYCPGNTDSRCVFRMKDILSDLTLPVKIRLIYGKPPVVPCIFTGMLVIKDCITEDVIIGSTISFKRHALFELPVTSNLKVYEAKSEDAFQEQDSYQDARKLCEKYSHSFGSLIKLSPELDTNKQMIQHVPSEKLKQRHESLKTLDLITNISLTDDEPRSQFMESSSDDTGSEQSLNMGTLIELKEFSNRSSMMC